MQSAVEAFVVYSLCESRLVFGQLERQLKIRKRE
jgi:hypothetical protein